MLDEYVANLIIAHAEACRVCAGPPRDDGTRECVRVVELRFDQSFRGR